MNVKNVDSDFMVPQDGYNKGDNIKSLNETKVNNDQYQCSVVIKKSCNLVELLNSPDEVKATENQESV